MDPLIWMRAIHFTATILVVGAIFFAVFVAEPAFRATNNEGAIAALVRSRLTWITSVSLLAVLISGAGWLILLAKQLSGLPLTAGFVDGPLWTVLTQTDFGQVWMARCLVAVLLAGVLLLPKSTRRSHSCWIGTIAALLAACLVGTLAWAGHAAANLDSDIKGIFHLIGDTLHLVAAAAWIGALAPLAVLLGAALGDRKERSILIARDAAMRFSTLGIVSVATLVITGIYNSWVLAGSVHALIDTDYGRLLLLKVALFVVMLSVAAINRLRLTPALIQGTGTALAWNAALQLRRNTVIEAIVGVVILIIVAVLGTTPPGLEEESGGSAQEDHASNWRFNHGSLGTLSLFEN